MRQLRKIFLAVCFFVAPAHADELTPQKEQDIRALLSEVGVIEATRASFVQSMAAVDIFRGCPECPSNAKEILTRVAADTITNNISSPGGLVEQLIPIYARHFTHPEIKQWLVFLRSPTGKKMASVQGALVSEVTPVSNAWIKTLVPKINQKAMAEMGIKR